LYSERLKELRKNKKLTQKEVAEKIGVARTTYAMYEQNRREPDNETFQKIADFFNVTTDYLLGRTDDPTMTAKDEKDIAKRMEKIKEDLANNGGLSFYGEPLSEEAKQSLLEAMEFAVRQAQRINKKYIPKKYRKDN